MNTFWDWLLTDQRLHPTWVAEKLSGEHPRLCYHLLSLFPPDYRLQIEYYLNSNPEGFRKETAEKIDPGFGRFLLAATLKELGVPSREIAERLSPQLDPILRLPGAKFLTLIGAYVNQCLGLIFSAFGERGFYEARFRISEEFCPPGNLSAALLNRFEPRLKNRLLLFYKDRKWTQPEFLEFSHTLFLTLALLGFSPEVQSLFVLKLPFAKGQPLREFLKEIEKSKRFPYFMEKGRLFFELLSQQYHEAYLKNLY